MDCTPSSLSRSTLRLGEDLVIYGGCGDGATGIWARPAKMFYEKFKCPSCDQEWARFCPVNETQLLHCACVQTEREILDAKCYIDAFGGSDSGGCARPDHADKGTQ